MYGWSVLHCLPATMAERPVEATGTVPRVPTVARWAAAAGFAEAAHIRNVAGGHRCDSGPPPRPATNEPGSGGVGRAGCHLAVIARRLRPGRRREQSKVPCPPGDVAVIGQ
jgi:hypothetical protein